MRDTRVAAAAERVVVPPLSDLPPGASTSVKDFGTTVAVPVAVNGSSVCNNHPHHGGPRRHGRVSGTCLRSRAHEYLFGREIRVLSRPWQGWVFDIESGQPCSTRRCGRRPTRRGGEDGQTL